MMWVPSSLLTFACLLVLAPSARAESLGPPPGSAGTIDFRYPDVIVDPIPPCPFEGVFPHPNNCTWYYRCYAAFVEGFYHRAYFQCEPGTVFNDGLDQCTWGSGPDGCSSSPGIIVPGKPVTGTTPPPTIVTLPGVITPEPPIIPPPTPPCTDCLNIVDECQLYTICPESPTVQVKIELCKMASKVCNPCKLSEVLCSGQWFSPSDNQCYPNPNDGNIACDPPVPPEPTPPPPPPCTDCYVSTSRCKPYTVCPNAQPEVTMTLCPNAKNVCLPCEEENDVCEPGQFFSMEDSKCYADPASPTMTCAKDPPKEEVVINEVSSNNIECSATNLVPSNDWIKKQFCSARPLCSQGQFLGMSKLCTNYYQCVPKDGGGWEAVKLACPPGMMFSFDENRCSPEPKPEELCGIIRG